LDAPILIYYKQRSSDEPRQVENALKRMNVDYQPLTYGSYTESEYMRHLHECSFVLWLGRQESQGMALQEALATAVPILVLDALNLFDVYPPTKLFPDRLRSL
jgi:hypothetical protein